MELNSHLPVIEIAGKVEDVALDTHAVFAAHSRPHTDIRDSHVLTAVLQIRLGGIDAVARDDDAFRKSHVDRGRSHLRAETEAVVHGVHQCMRMTEKGIRPLHLPGLDELTDIG